MKSRINLNFTLIVFNMSLTSLILLLSCCSSAKLTTIENYESGKNIFWGSISSQSPNYGFYGQEFEFDKNTKVESISIYIVDHKKYDEKKATINFSIWEFEEKPIKELFISKKTQVLENEIGNWKTYKFEKPLPLKKGKFLFAIGQSDIQGFIAFGNSLKKNGYSSSFWMKTPKEDFSNGKDWFKFVDYMKSINPVIPDSRLDKIQKGCVMMKLEVK